MKEKNKQIPEYDADYFNFGGSYYQIIPAHVADYLGLKDKKNGKRIPGKIRPEEGKHGRHTTSWPKHLDKKQ